MKYAILYLPILLLVACGSENKAEKTESIAWDTAAAFSSDSEVEMDDVYIPDFRKDESDFSLTAFIIQPGIYRSHEVTMEMKNASWYTLTKDNSTIGQNTVALNKEIGEYEDTTWQVSGEFDKEVHLANINNIKTGALQAVALDTNMVAPGENIFFDYNDTHYRLYASGYMSSDRNTIFNYRLILEAQKDGVITQQILFAHSYYGNYRSCIIEFAGDIDNDKKLDIIIRDAEPDGSTIMLYLSGEAEEGQLLWLSGFHQSFIEMGC